MTPNLITKNIIDFFPKHQLRLVKELLNGDEGKYFENILIEFDKRISEMPATYESEKEEDKKLAYLHYFAGDSHWYILEKDKGDPDDEKNEVPAQSEAFGWVILNGDLINAEYGYISIAELRDIPEVELDFYFEPTPIRDIISRKKQGITTEEAIEETPISVEAEWNIRHKKLAKSIYNYLIEQKLPIIINIELLDNYIEIKSNSGNNYLIEFDNDSEDLDVYISVFRRISPDEIELIEESKARNELEREYDAGNALESYFAISQYIIKLINQDSDKSALASQASPEITKGQNQTQINERIRELLREKGTNRSLYTNDEIQLLKLYEGVGGKEGTKAGNVRTFDQFFTPYEVCETVWQLVIKHGFQFKDSWILEPAAGRGRFLDFIPTNVDASVETFEIDEICWKILQIIFAWCHNNHGSFEEAFFDRNDTNRHNGYFWGNRKFDLVIGNPPYKEYGGRFSIYEKPATLASTYDQYFLMRGIDVLKPGGLLAYVMPASFMHNDLKYNKFKDKLIEKADLVEAYRLPSGVFATTEVTTDILIFRKK